MNANDSTTNPDKTGILFRDPLLQRLIVLDSSGRWLGAIRAEVAGIEQRSVVPALDWADAATQSHRVEQALVLCHISSDQVNSVTDKRSVAEFTAGTRHFAVGDQDLQPWRLPLVEAGFARVFTSILQLSDVIRLAQRFFSGQIASKPNLQRRLLLKMPWPNHASAISMLTDVQKPSISND
jgi:hypothetical protein